MKLVCCCGASIEFSDDRLSYQCGTQQITDFRSDHAVCRTQKTIEAGETISLYEFALQLKLTHGELLTLLCKHDEFRIKRPAITIKSPEEPLCMTKPN